MNGEEAKKELCGEAGCGQGATLTLRKQTLGDAVFECFCKAHLAKAVEWVRALWKARYSVAGKSDCSVGDCKHQSVLMMRIASPKVEMWSFCSEHLSIAFEATAALLETVTKEPHGSC